MRLQDEKGGLSETNAERQIRNRRKNNPEDVVRVLTEEDGIEPHFSFPKAKDAVWVKGLSEQDERDEIESLKRKERKKEEKMKGKFLVIPLGRNWLLYPNLIGLLFVVMMLKELCSYLFFCNSYRSLTPLDRSEELGFISSPDAFFTLMKRRGEGPVDFFFRVFPIIFSFPMLVGSLYALSLAIKVGFSTQHFSALCGVGCSLLYFLAGAAQFYISSFSTAYLFSISGVDQGFSTPRKAAAYEVAVDLLSLYYLAMVVKHILPLISLILVSPSVALAMGKPYLSKWFRALLSIPLFFWSLYLLSFVFPDEVVDTISPFISLTLVYSATLGSWGAFIVICLRHKEFEIPFFSPPVTQ